VKTELGIKKNHILTAFTYRAMLQKLLLKAGNFLLKINLETTAPLHVCVQVTKIIHLSQQ